MYEAKPIAPRRRSASVDAALRTGVARIEAMMIEEWVKAALYLPERFAWLAPPNPPQSSTSTPIHYLEGKCNLRIGEGQAICGTNTCCPTQKMSH